MRAVETKSSTRWDFWPLRHLIRVMRKHDLTNKKTTTKTKTSTMTKTFRDHPQWGIFWDILRTPSDGNPREVLSLTNYSLLWIQSDPSRPNWWGLTQSWRLLDIEARRCWGQVTLCPFNGNILNLNFHLVLFAFF